MQNLVRIHAVVSIIFFARLAWKRLFTPSTKLWKRKNPRHRSFSLGHVDPSLIHPCRDQPPSPHQTTYRSIHTISHNYAEKSLLVTMGRPKFTPKLSFSFDDYHPSNTRVFDRPTHTPNGTRIQSAVLPQYTCRTDRPTDRQTVVEKPVPIPAYALSDIATRQQIAYECYADLSASRRTQWMCS